MKLVSSLVLIIAVVARLKTKSKKKVEDHIQMILKPHKPVGDSSVGPEISDFGVGPETFNYSHKPRPKVPDTDPKSILKNGSNGGGKYSPVYSPDDLEKLRKIKEERLASFKFARIYSNPRRSRLALKYIKQLGSSLLDAIQDQLDNEKDQEKRNDLLKEKNYVLKIIINPTFGTTARKYYEHKDVVRIPSDIIEPATMICGNLWKDLNKRSETDEYFLNNFLKEAAREYGFRNEEETAIQYELRSLTITTCIVGFVESYPHSRILAKISLESLARKQRKELIHNFVYLVTQIASNITMYKEPENGTEYSDLLDVLTSQAKLEFDYDLTQLEERIIAMPK